MTGIRMEQWAFIGILFGRKEKPKVCAFAKLFALGS